MSSSSWSSLVHVLWSYPGSVGYIIITIHYFVTIASLSTLFSLDCMKKEKRVYKCNYTRTKRIYVRAILPVFETDSSSSFGFIVGQILSLTSSFASFKIHWRKLLTDCPLHDGFSAKQDKTSCRKRKYTRFYFLENIFCPLSRIFQTFVLTKRQWKPSRSFE